MRIAALTSFLVAAAATVVSAAPRSEETTERVSYKDARAKADAAKDDGWVELASPTPTSHGKEYIDVGATLTRLRLDVAKGRPIVRSVRVDYRDGHSKTFPIDKMLAKDRPTYVDLRGAHEIDRVVVQADTDSHGSYTVRGSREATGVASR